MERRPPGFGPCRAGHRDRRARPRRSGPSGGHRCEHCRCGGQPARPSASAHVRASLDQADPQRQPAPRRATGVLVATREPLADGVAALPVPWAETALSAELTDSGLEVCCVHVPNAANGWVKVRDAQGDPGRPRGRGASSARAVWGPEHARDASCPTGRFSRSVVTLGESCDQSVALTGMRRSSALSPDWVTLVTTTPSVSSMGMPRGSPAGLGSASPGTKAAGDSTTCSRHQSCNRWPAPITTSGGSAASATTRHSKPIWRRPDST